MKNWWWKIIGGLIVLFTVIIGLTTPLKPGVISITPNRFLEGTLARIQVEGYNTNFDRAKNLVAYLRIDSLNGQYLEAISYEVESYNKVIFDFRLPDNATAGNQIVTSSLLISDDIDGSFTLPSAIFIGGNKEVNGNNATNLSNFPATLYESNQYRFPYRPILNETIRNTFFHITLWFSMFIILLGGLYYAIRYLSTKELDYDHRSKALTTVALLFGIMGLITGSIWARFTWGTWWTSDVKLNMSAVAMLIYLAYFVLRSSISDQDQEARLASVFNIFAFVALIPLVFVIPRLTDSLHPGNGGNPALGEEDMDNTLRMVFYPAIIGFSLLGLWMATLYYRYVKLEEKVKLG